MTEFDTGGFRTPGLQRLLDRTREAIDDFHRRGRASHCGEALDGQIEVVVTGGRVAILRLSPAVLRRAPDDLAGHIAAAVNSALTGAAGTYSTVDTESLTIELSSLRERSVAQMREFGAAMDDVMARTRTRGR